MSMDKVRISNAIGTSENEYPAPVAISVNGVVWGPAIAPQVDTKKLTIGPIEGAISGRRVVGPRDQFIGPWQPGDRQPTEMEQVSKPDWFRDLPNTNIETRTVENFGASRTVAANMGGETPLIYPSGSQSLTLVTGVVPGITAYSFVIPEGSKPGVGRISLTQAESGDCAGTFAISTEKGATQGPSVLDVQTGNMPVFHFQAGKGKPGYGQLLPTGVVLYLNAKYTGSPGSNQLVQIEAHDRT